MAIKLRPTDDEVHELGPAFKDRWETFFKDRPDKPVLWMTVMSGYELTLDGAAESLKYTVSELRVWLPPCPT